MSCRSSAPSPIASFAEVSGRSSPVMTALTPSIFTASAVAGRDAAPRIEKALAAQLGVSSRIIVLTAAQLACIVAENPMLAIAVDPSRLFVTVLRDPADRAKLEPLLKQDWAPDVMATGERVAYVWCPAGMAESRLAEAVGRVLGDAATTRNWATISKLHALMGAK